MEYGGHSVQIFENYDGKCVCGTCIGRALDVPRVRMPNVPVRVCRR